MWLGQRCCIEHLRSGHAATFLPLKSSAVQCETIRLAATLPQAVRPRTENPFAKLPALADDDAVHLVIETAKGSRNKYAFDEELANFNAVRSID